MRHGIEKNKRPSSPARRSIHTGSRNEHVASGSGTYHRHGELALGSADGESWRTVRITQRNPIYAVAVSPDQSRIAIGHGDGTVVLWDVAGNLQLEDEQ